MSLLGNIIGFGAFGFGARCFQLGLQKRNMFDGELRVSRESNQLELVIEP
jgi:hypothetical protein